MNKLCLECLRHNRCDCADINWEHLELQQHIEIGEDITCWMTEDPIPVLDFRVSPENPPKLSGSVSWDSYGKNFSETEEDQV